MFFKNISSLLFLLLLVSVCYAAWQDDFPAVYKEKGIEEAIKMALMEGANPDQIIKEALPLEGLEEVILMKGLFCVLPQPEAIEDAAQENGITNETISDGYELALTECARQMEENLNAVIYDAARFPELAPSKRIRRTIYEPVGLPGPAPIEPPKPTSPWKFE